MKNIACVFGLVLSSLLGSGCSSKQDIEGEAFVDSGNGATRIALVALQVVPEDKFIAHIKKQLPKADVQTTELQTSIAKFQKLDSDAQALLGQSAMLRMQSAFMPSAGGMMDTASALVNAQNSQSANTLQSTMEAGRKILRDEAAALNGLSTGANPLYFSDKIDGAVLFAESNADGKFILSLEKGKKVVLVGVKDNLAWAIWLTPDKSKSTVTLTNKNLSGSGCSDCVFDGKVTPKSIVGGG